MVNWGRQTGKSQAAAIEALIAALGTLEVPDPLVWVIAPVYSEAEIIWNALRHYLHATPFATFRDTFTNNPMRMKLKNGGTIECKTADDPDKLRGFSLHMVVLEEAAQQPEYLLTNVILPSFNVTRGRLLAISTPRGRNWFYRWALRGQDQAVEDVAYFHATSYDNPYADPAVLETARVTLPDLAYRQEYMAEFVEESGLVFRRVRQAVRRDVGLPIAPIAGKPYVIGVDWAKINDFTVFTVLDCHARQVVAWERFNSLDYNVQIARLKDLASEYNRAYVLMDASNESSLVDICRKEGIRAEGFKFTYESKKSLVDGLVVAIERGEIALPDVSQIINELEAYEYQQTRAGNVKMGAPEGAGYYDDCVMSLGLAWRAARQRRGGAAVIYGGMSGARVA